MKQYVVPIIFVLGIVCLISSLTYKLHFTDKQTSDVVTETIMIEDSEELNFFIETDMGVFNDTDIEYTYITKSEIDEMFGFLKYSTNIESNYSKLIESMPDYLATNDMVHDIIDNPNMLLTSRFLDERTTMYFLCSLFENNTDIYLTQYTENKKNTFTIGKIEGFRLISSITVSDNYYMLHMLNGDNTIHKLVLIGNVDGVPAILLEIETEDFVSVDSGIKIDGVPYLPIMKDNTLIFRDEFGGELVAELSQ